MDESRERSQLDLLSELLPDVISAFRKLNADGREKLFQTIATIFGLSASKPAENVHLSPHSTAPTHQRFSKDRTISAKEFIMKKQPRTDVERVACLAYYLTHYKEQPHFKTGDIANANTEAAQVRLSNPTYAVQNATNYGYLVPAAKGSKQLSGVGEMFVEALPDREAAKLAMASGRPKRKSKRQREE